MAVGGVNHAEIMCRSPSACLGLFRFRSLQDASQQASSAPEPPSQWRRSPPVQAYVSLWSADLLDVGRAMDSVAGTADGFHLDVFDGHNVDDLLFGPDFVAAVRRRTTLPLDVHLNVDDP